MRVLFLSNLFPDTREPYRGLDNATLLHHLARHCEIRVMSPRPVLPFRSEQKIICREVDAKFHPVYPKTFYVPKFGSLFNHHLFASAIRHPLQELRKDFDFDVILVSWTFPDTAAVAKLQHELKVPFVGIVQGSDAHVYLRMPLRKPIIVSALNHASSAITRSAKLAQLLEEAGVSRGKLHPVYNGVDLDTFHPDDRKAAKQELGLSEDLPMVLFVGNFYPVKNPLLLVRSHAEMCRKFPAQKCKLVMIGGGPLEKEIRRVADECGTADNVILAGRKNAGQVARYMQAADALCLSSENEGVPNVILEAFASGLKVVSTDVGGISEVLNRDFLGKLVPKGNSSALAEALGAALREPSGSDEIREHALQFSWTRAKEAYLKILERVTEVGTGT